MDIFAQMAVKIIREQESIIGPVALEQARKVPGLKVDWQKHEVVLGGDEKAIIDSLVKQYEALFGQTSIEVCKDAIKGLSVPADSLPALLK